MADLTPRENPIEAGETAPDFTLKTKDKEDWTLSAHLADGDVVLCFFPFAFTGVCGTEMECLSKEMARFTDQGVTPVGISCDSFAALGAWAERDGYTNTLLSDQHREVCRAYGVYWADMNTTTRATVVVGRGEDGSPRVKWAQTRAPGDAMDLDEVLARLA